MFSKKWMNKSTNDYWDKISNLKKTIENADAIIIGAGAGLSTSAGLEYSGKRFFDHFPTLLINMVCRICIQLVFILLKH